jgi:hypothetical protein
MRKYAGRLIGEGQRILAQHELVRVFGRRRAELLNVVREPRLGADGGHDGLGSAVLAVPPVAEDEDAGWRCVEQVRHACTHEEVQELGGTRGDVGNVGE